MVESRCFSVFIGRCSGVSRDTSFQKDPLAPSMVERQNKRPFWKEERKRNKGEAFALANVRFCRGLSSKIRSSAIDFPFVGEARFRLNSSE